MSVCAVCVLLLVVGARDACMSGSAGIYYEPKMFVCVHAHALVFVYASPCASPCAWLGRHTSTVNMQPLSADTPISLVSNQ